MQELEKPPVLAARGGCWFRGGALEVHLGVEEPFGPNRKAHPGLLVDGLAALARRLEDAGHPVTWDDDFPRHDRFYAADPFGNRLEFLQPQAGWSWDAPPVTPPPRPAAEDVVGAPAKVQFETFLDEHRAALDACLEGLSEEQARRSLVPSRTTLLGLVKHATFVERVWFEEAVTCRSRAELGIAATPDESFVLDDTDTIDTVRRAHLDACRSSRAAVAGLGLDDLLRGNRRGPLPLRWVYLHVLRELAQHCGHADILREQILRG
jgi:hypothetical protein